MSVGAVNKQTGDRIPTAGMPAIDDALDLTSVNPVQNAVITAALANKQDKTDNALQTTDKTVVGAVNELKSGLTNVDVALSVPDGAGKNVLPMTLATIKAANTSGTWNDNVYTYKSLTYTVETNNEGYITSIKVNGTADSQAVFVLFYGDIGTGSYTLNGITGGSNSTYLFYAPSAFGEVYSEKTANVSGSFEIDLYVRSGVALSNQMFYPMIRPATITDPTFAPYIPSVESRIEAVESGLTNKANVATYNMSGGQTVNIRHTGIVAIMSDRGGLYTDGISNRGVNDLVPSTQITVTHVDTYHVTVANNSQYGTSILVLSDGYITITLVQ